MIIYYITSIVNREISIRMQFTELGRLARENDSFQLTTQRLFQSVQLPCYQKLNLWSQPAKHCSNCLVTAVISGRPSGPTVLPNKCQLLLSGKTVAVDHLLSWREIEQKSKFVFEKRRSYYLL